MAREMVTPIPGTNLKTSSFKITGWSARHNGESLLSYVTGLGSLITYIHYPQLTTTYVTLRSEMNKYDLARAISQFTPKARVEFEQSRSTLEAEKDLETPDVTAFITSRAFLNEVDISGKLKVYGSLRALNFSFSTKFQKWYCKATFYDKYSLNQLLLSIPTCLQTLSKGGKVKIEQFKKAGCNYESQCTQAPEFKSYPVLEAQRASSFMVKKQQISNRGQIARLNVDPQAKKIRTKTRVSKSSSRETVQRLPTAGFFSNTNLYIENILRILKSRQNENISKTSVRSKSTESSPRKESSISISFPFKKGKTHSRSSGLQNFTFSKNELLFLEIGQSHGTSSYVFTTPNSNPSTTSAQQSGESYLSQSDLSDGYTAYEEEIIKLNPVIKSDKLTHRSQDSEKKSSLILLTKYSSDAEHSLPELIGKHSVSPSRSNIDTLFGSRLGPENFYGAYRQFQVGNQFSPEINIDFFTFPCS